MELELKEVNNLKNEGIEKRLPKDILKILKAFEVEADIIDFDSEFQQAKDVEDKYIHFVELIKEYSPLNATQKNIIELELLNVNIKKEEKAKEEASKQENKILRENYENKLLDEFKKIDNKFLNSPSYFQMKERIKMIVKGFYDVVFVTSEGGWSKTTLGFQLTKGYDTAYISCKATPLELYHMLYENKDKELIILDDLKWDNEQLISILKGAWQSLSNGKRLVQYNSSKIQIPKVFDIKARFICFANSIPNTIDMNALISRTLFYEFKPNYKEKLHLIKQVAQKPYKKLKLSHRNEVFEFIVSNTTPATKRLNLRTYFKICEYYRYDKEKWRKLAIEELQADSRLYMVCDLIESGLPVEEQVERYKTETGESRATFFRLKNKL